jgi:hypothetical protein
MNKYQKYFLKEDAYIDCFALGSDINCSLDRTLENGVVRIKQNEDISIKEYTLASRYPFDYLCENEWRKSSKMENRVWQIAKFDWAVPIEKVRFLVDNEFVEALEINIEYEFADVEAYDKKQEQKRKNDLIENASIKHSTGADLVNIYFQPCSSDYIRTEIALYRDGLMLAKYKVDEESFFKSIGGLAYGTYSFIVKQFDKSDNLLLETEHIEFTVKAPKAPVMGRISRI